MKLSLILTGFITFVSIGVFGCKTTQNQSSEAKDISDIKVMSQRADGNFDVFCNDGAQEVRSKNELLANQVCDNQAAAIIKRCECINNNGPDLWQIGYNPATDKELWKTKLFGWNNNSGTADLCNTRIRTDPMCKSDAPVASVATNCECVSNNGPDLLHFGRNVSTGAELWKTKIDGWDNSAGSFDKCYASIANEPICQPNVATRNVYQRCDCSGNNGPDLNQYGINAKTNVQVWKTKLYGWGNISGNYNKCYAELRTNKLCQLAPTMLDVSSRCYCKQNNGPDLLRVVYDANTGNDISETKIEGWDNISGNFEKCFESLKNENTCRSRSSPAITRHCECIGNNGPDLMQHGTRVSDGTRAWSVRLMGWDNNSGNFAKCQNALQTLAQCR